MPDTYPSVEAVTTATLPVRRLAAMAEPLQRLRSIVLRIVCVSAALLAIERNIFTYWMGRTLNLVGE